MLLQTAGVRQEAQLSDRLPILARLSAASDPQITLCDRVYDIRLLTKLSACSIGASQIQLFYEHNASAGEKLSTWLLTRNRLRVLRVILYLIIFLLETYNALAVWHGLYSFHVFPNRRLKRLARWTCLYDANYAGEGYMKPTAWRPVCLWAEYVQNRWWTDFNKTLHGDSGSFSYVAKFSLCFLALLSALAVLSGCTLA